MEFGQYVRKLRKEKKITLIELAEKTGLSQPYLSKIEMGKRPIPTVNTLHKLRDALDAHPIGFMNAAGVIPHVDSLIEAFGFIEGQPHPLGERAAFMKDVSKDFTDLYMLLDRPDLELYFKTNKISRDDRLLLKLLLEKIFPMR